MKKIFREVHRRSLWQVLGIYIAGGWLALQVVGTLADVVGIPDWFGPIAIGMLILGLPIVLATAFVQKGAPMIRPVAAPFADPVPKTPSAELVELSTAAPPAAEAPATGPRRAHHHLFTWRNVIVGGIAACLVLGLGTAGWFGLRAAGIGPAATLVAQGVFDESDQIILADFGNRTDDDGLGEVITEAIRVDLSQSEVVRFADRGFVDGALERMQRPTDTKLTEDVAREIGQREGLKAVVAGEVASAGGGYILTARLVTPEDGEALVSVRETVRDPEDLLDGIDKLAADLRERIGDPLRSIAASPPLARATTSDFEALEKFSESLRLPADQLDRKIVLLEEAVELDSTFAMAWRGIGIELNNYAIQPGKATRAHIRAYELRDRLPEMERLRVNAFYYNAVVRDYRQAIPVFESMLARDPDNLAALNNMGEMYRNLGDLGRAEEIYFEVLARDSMMEIPLLNVAQVQASQGRFDEALAAADLIEARHPGLMAPAHRYLVEISRRAYAAAAAYEPEMRGLTAGSTALLAFVERGAAVVAASRGQLEEAESRYDEVAELNQQIGAIGDAVSALAEAQLTTASVTGTAPDLDAFDASISEYPLDDLDPSAILLLSRAYSEFGEPARARSAIEAFEAATTPEEQQGQRHDLRRSRGYLALAEGRDEDAVEEFREAVPDNLEDLTGLAELAWAFEAAGATDSARIYLQRYAESPGFVRHIADARFLGPTLERLGQIYDEAGDPENALRFYAEFVELWADADAVLQPRVAAAQARIQAIVEERG